MTTLLIDADVLLWRASSAVQKVIDFGDGVIVTSADIEHAKDKLDSEIVELMSKLRAGRAIMALSDPRKNWRKEVYPTYKSNRTKGKPVVYWELRNYMLEKYDARWYRGLEGDDVLGLYATGTKVEEPKIIVSIDKDMQCLPCRLYNPNKPERGVRTIEEHEANEFHLMQTLMGDSVDGYPGVPGIGAVRAANLLQGKLYSEQWQECVRCAARSGLSEDFILTQARVAHILRAGEYDKETGHVTLWQPPPPPLNLAEPTSTSKTPASARSGRPAPAATPKKGKAASTSSRRSSSAASPSTSKAAPRSTATTTGRRASRSPGTSTPPSGTSAAPPKAKRMRTTSRPSPGTPRRSCGRSRK